MTLPRTLGAAAAAASLASGLPPGRGSGQRPPVCDQGPAALRGLRRLHVRRRRRLGCVDRPLLLVLDRGYAQHGRWHEPRLGMGRGRRPPLPVGRRRGLLPAASSYAAISHMWKRSVIAGSKH